MLACYKDFYARIWYDEEEKKWIGRVLDSEDILVFDGTTLEDVLSTFHGGIEAYIEAAGGTVPKRTHAQVMNMIRFGIEERPFMDAAKELLNEVD